MVSATSPAGWAPTYVSFRPNVTSDNLYALLASECQLGSGIVVNVSATMTWDGKQLRIRKGKQGDGDVNLLQNRIQEAWTEDMARFKYWVKVEMLLHVDV